MSVIIALPPESEVSLDEAVTIARRIALSPCGSHSVPIHIAIHNALVNRHAHAAIGFRTMAPDGEFGLKIPELFACFSVYGAKAKVSEGTDWPDISWEIQATLFLERGIDLVVDPFAPVPEEHLDVDFHDDDTRRRVKIRGECLRDANISAIKASPDASDRGRFKGTFGPAGGRAASALRTIHRQRSGQARGGGSDSDRPKPHFAG
jgi:hypothetical protein